jgi:hypothetical protein
VSGTSTDSAGEEGWPGRNCAWMALSEGLWRGLRPVEDFLRLQGTYPGHFERRRTTAEGPCHRQPLCSGKEAGIEPGVNSEPGTLLKGALIVNLALYWTAQTAGTTTRLGHRWVGGAQTLRRMSQRANTTTNLALCCRKRPASAAMKMFICLAVDAGGGVLELFVATKAHPFLC